MNLSRDSLLYRSGDAFLNSKTVKFLGTYILGNDKSLYYINLWSLVHLLTGYIFFQVFGDRPYKALFVHIPWELWQMLIGMTKLDPRGMIDSLNDTAFFMVGFYLAKNFSK